MAHLMSLLWAGLSCVAFLPIISIAALAQSCPIREIDQALQKVIAENPPNPKLLTFKSISYKDSFKGVLWGGVAGCHVEYVVTFVANARLSVYANNALYPNRFEVIAAPAAMSADAAAGQTVTIKVEYTIMLTDRGWRFMPEDRPPRFDWAGAVPTAPAASVPNPKPRVSSIKCDAVPGTVQVAAGDTFVNRGEDGGALCDVIVSVSSGARIEEPLYISRGDRSVIFEVTVVQSGVLLIFACKHPQVASMVKSANGVEKYSCS